MKFLVNNIVKVKLAWREGSLLGFVCNLKTNKMAMYDVIVCGAGIQGLWTANYLVKQKQKVLLLEQFSLNHKRGCSHGPSRITRYSYETPHHAKMMPEAFQCWSELEKEQNVQLFVNCGLITIGNDEKIATVSKSLNPLDIQYEVMQPSEIKSRFPGVCSGNWKGIFEKSGGVLKADQCCQAVQHSILSHGGIIHDTEVVLSVLPISNCEVRVVTNKMTYQSRSIVLTCGPWINKILKTLDLQIPAKSFSELLGGKRPKLIQGIIKLSHDDHLFRKEYGSHLLYTDYGASKSNEEISDPDFPEQYDKQKGEKQQQELLRMVKAHLPNLIPVPVLQETCLYSATADKDFILDRHPKYKNIVIGAGFSGHGFKISPTVGHILGDLALNRNPTYPMEKFALKRFDTKSNL